MSDPWLFGLAVLAILATPGPTNTLLMTSGATVGLARSLPLLLAEAGGYNLAIFVVGRLLGPLVAGVPGARGVLGVAVGVYLCVIAARLWRRGVRADEGAVSWRDVFSTTLLNPKVLVFAFVVFPIDVTNVALYFAAFNMILLPVGAAWVTFGASAGRLVPHHRVELVPRIAAVVLAGFGLLLIGSFWAR